VTNEQFARLLSAVRTVVREELSRRRDESDADLVIALQEYFGDGVFTVAGILEVVDADPYHPLTSAIERSVDMKMNSQGRATKLGQILASLPDLDLVGERRGASLYRVRP
jgi:hypothetical protein